MERGSRVGLVANDQGVGLVDAQRFQMLENSGGRTRAITGGCFCCKADDLVATLRELQAVEQPEVILAEPVGSCMDLVATVLRPLEQVYAEGYRMAPLSVVVDAVRLWSAEWHSASSRKEEGDAAGPMKRSVTPRSCFGKGFANEVQYIYRKQMEEAEVLALNKVDLLSKAKRAALVKWIKAKFPSKQVFEISTKTGEGLEAWCEWLLTHEQISNDTLEVDYDPYAQGEALLGWYNAELSVHAVKDDFDGNALLLRWAKAVQARLTVDGVGIAHLKMSLERCGGLPGAKQGGSDLAIVQVVGDSTRPELSERLGPNLVVGKLLVNLRAAGPPKLLRKAMQECLQASTVRRLWLEEAAFKPSRPVPVHRISGTDPKSEMKKEKIL